MVHLKRPNYTNSTLRMEDVIEKKRQGCTKKLFFVTPLPFFNMENQSIVSSIFSSAS